MESFECLISSFEFCCTPGIQPSKSKTYNFLPKLLYPPYLLHLSHPHFTSLPNTFYH